MSRAFVADRGRREGGVWFGGYVVTVVLTYESVSCPALHEPSKDSALELSGMLTGRPLFQRETETVGSRRAPWHLASLSFVCLVLVCATFGPESLQLLASRVDVVVLRRLPPSLASQPVHSRRSRHALGPITAFSGCTLRNATVSL